MIDLHLRTDTKEEMIDACPQFWSEEQQDWITGTRDYALSVVGKILEVEGEYDEEGNVITPPVYDERYLLNIRCTEEIANTIPEDIVVTPNNPIQVWL